jgi:hypothetical protein
VDSEDGHESHDCFYVVESKGGRRRIGRERERGSGRQRSLTATLLRYDFALAENMVCAAQRLGNVAGDGERKALSFGGDKSQVQLGGYATTWAGREGRKACGVRGMGHEVLCNAEMRSNPAKAVGILKDSLREEQPME